MIGEGLPLGAPGSVKGVQLVVEDIDEIREEFAGRGIGVSDVQQLGPEGSPRLASSSSSRTRTATHGALQD